MAFSSSDEWLYDMFERLTIEDIKFLKCLQDNKAVTPAFCLGKIEMITKSNFGLTDFKFLILSARLELPGFIKKVYNKRAAKYYITSLGLHLLEEYSNFINGAINNKKSK